MRSKNLLAKSFRNSVSPPAYALLTNHSRDVADAGDALLKAIGQRAISNAGLPGSMWEPLAKSTRLNFWLQDLGKANSHFLAMVESNPEFDQILRHEAISGLIAKWPPIRDWLESSYGPDSLYPALWAAVGHHRKFGGDYLKAKLSPPAEVYLGHPDFRTILSDMAERLGLDINHLGALPRILTIGSSQGPTCDIQATKAISDMKEEFKRWSEEHTDPEFDRSIGIMKAIGIAADVCASAFARSSDAVRGRPIAEFVTETLSVGLHQTDLDELMRRYVWDRTEEDDTRPENPDGFPPGFEFREFQREVAEVDSSAPLRSYLTFAVAGCGSGKSLAAYLWAQRWCQAWDETGWTNFRLFFTLPTTGTATEHFKDYALACGVSPKLKGLSHSRSSVDLTFVAEETAPQEESRGKSNASKQAEEMLKAQADKIESLDLWGTPLVVGTTDTVLGLMANSRRPVYSFPAIMQSAIVFDEIHAYDEQLFGHLLMFLETFPKVPVLLMTASLPEARRKAIEDVRCDLRIVMGPKEHELRLRYAKPELLSEEDVWEHIRRCLSDPARGKVLWVRNQVDRVVRSYRACHTRLSDLQPFIGIYHSRFRYKDRTRVHSEVIRRFKKKGGPCVLVATQVAEMSLDLSADLLISDLASIPALIQRLGRLNRFATTDSGPSGLAIFCEPPPVERTGRPDPLPYEEDDLKKAEAWIEELRKKDRRLNQRDLAETFSEFDSGKAVRLEDARQRAVFVSGRWQTLPASTRGDGTTMPVVLQADYDTYPKDRLLDFAFRRDWLREHEVSIPIRAEMRHWRVLGYTPIAPCESVVYGHIDHPDIAERIGAAWADHRSSTA
jgi:CRISPR-associated endonuclease/helicase Cas3